MAKLTRQQIAVMELIASGLTNPEIAAKLYKSINTVKGNIRCAKAALGIPYGGTRTALVKAYRELHPDPGTVETNLTPDALSALLTSRPTELPSADLSAVALLLARLSARGATPAWLTEVTGHPSWLVRNFIFYGQQVERKLRALNAAPSDLTLDANADHAAAEARGTGTA